MKDRALFFSHKLYNKDGQKLVDENEDWCIYFVHVAKYVCSNGIGITPRTKVGRTLVWKHMSYMIRCTILIGNPMGGNLVVVTFVCNFLKLQVISKGFKSNASSCKVQMDENLDFVEMFLKASSYLGLLKELFKVQVNLTLLAASIYVAIFATIRRKIPIYDYKTVTTNIYN